MLVSSRAWPRNVAAANRPPLSDSAGGATTSPPLPVGGADLRLSANQPPHHPLEGHRVSRGVEDVVAQSRQRGVKPVPGQNTARLTSHGWTGINDPHPRPHHSLDGRPQERVVGAAQYQGVNPRRQHGLQIPPQNLLCLRPLQFPRLHQRCQVRTGLGVNLCSPRETLQQAGEKLPPGSNFSGDDPRPCAPDCAPRPVSARAPCPR